jgi:hypothetical protein
MSGVYHAHRSTYFIGAGVVLVSARQSVKSLPPSDSH